jgi:hypothetical protein
MKSALDMVFTRKRILPYPDGSSTSAFPSWNDLKHLWKPAIVCFCNKQAKENFRRMPAVVIMQVQHVSSEKKIILLPFG